MAIRPFDVNKYPITQRFGVPNYNYRLKYHPGVDYKTPTGVAVKAPEKGFVRWLWSNSYGYVAALVLANGDVLWFAHNSRRGKTGSVNKGDVIAYTGNTGWSTGPHSHIEHRIGGDQNKPRDFEKWLRDNPEPKPKPVPKPPLKPKYNMPKIGQAIQLIPRQKRGTFKAGTTQIAGTINVTNNTFVYTVRGYDKKYPNRILINSSSAGGNGVALALYYTDGRNIGGWKIIK
jgi:hypothetical protein